ncbi:MAG: hypothetical protein HW421_3426 [Ignavibacteria bacterium]|nr:hypothetical protein [Ignavibacteria bacterium]
MKREKDETTTEYMEKFHARILKNLKTKSVKFKSSDIIKASEYDYAEVVFINEYGTLPFTFDDKEREYYHVRNSENENPFILEFVLEELLAIYPGLSIIQKMFKYNNGKTNYIFEIIPGLLLSIFASELVNLKNHKIDKELPTEEMLCFYNFQLLYMPELEDEFLKIVRIIQSNKTTFDNNAEVFLGVISYEPDSFYYVKHLKITDNIEKFVEPDLHYKPGFNDFYSGLIERFRNNNKGLALFYGPPGTGKTYCIRNIISDLRKDRFFIYVPSNMLNNILEPSFISFLTEYIVDNKDKKIILIIEDAEVLLRDREENGNQGISNLLNLTDGLLNDILGFQVIATFNMEIENLDKAILRDGRLLARKEFSRLSIDEAKTLKTFLGLNGEVTKEMSLAEIYTQKMEKEILVHNVKPDKEKGILGFFA